MATFKYLSGTPATLQDNTSSSLASAAAVTCATSFDNSATGNLFFWGDLELQVTFSVAPAAGTVIECYLDYAPDGTNYADVDNTTPPFNLFVGTFPVRAVTTAQRIILRGVPLSPFKLQAYLRNQAGQTMSAGWVLKLYPYQQQG